MTTLQQLRPSTGGDLHQLHGLLEGRGWQSTLPQSLPEPVLLRLARDFRCVEMSATETESSDYVPSLAPAMYVVMKLLAQHPARKDEKGALELSESGLMHALQLYQLDLEREIVSRIVGISPSSLTTKTLERLWHCVQE